MCTLKVRGTDSRLGEFAQEAGLSPLSVIRDGQHLHWPSGRSSTVLSRREKPGDYGFHVPVSNRDWDDLKGQFADAIEFLSKHKEALLRLQELKPRQARLDFPAETDPSKKHVIIFDVTVPVDLCRAASEVGLAVEITLYFATRKEGGEGSNAEPGEPEPPSKGVSK